MSYEEGEDIFTPKYLPSPAANSLWEQSKDGNFRLSTGHGDWKIEGEKPTPKRIEIKNEIQRRANHLHSIARTIGASIRWPVFSLALGRTLTSANEDAYNRVVMRLLHTDGGFTDGFFPPVIDPIPVPKVSSYLPLDTVINNLMWLCHLRPARLAELEANVRRIEAWIDRRIAGLNKFGKNLEHQFERHPKKRDPLKPYPVIEPGPRRMILQ